MAMNKPSFELMCWVNSVENRRQATARFRANRISAKTGAFLRRVMRLFYPVADLAEIPALQVFVTSVFVALQAHSRQIPRLLPRMNFTRCAASSPPTSASIRCNASPSLSPER